jgi:hypothetical protein
MIVTKKNRELRARRETIDEGKTLLKLLDGSIISAFRAGMSEGTGFGIWLRNIELALR